MQYRTLGKTGVRVSALGFGAMRFPTLGNDTLVDERAAIEMLRYAFDHGVNYVDTAYVYHGGVSETLVGKALADGYRQRVHVATKLPIWAVQSQADCDRILNEQLQRLQTDHIDFYLLHCVQKTQWPRMQQIRVIDWVRRAQSMGRITHIGFSFHDNLDFFKEVVDEFDWAFCQIQYNLVNETVQAGTQGLEYAAAKGLGVIIMEPLFGGTLANPPEPIRQIWQSGSPPADPVDTALQWVWNKPQVSLLLSGMSTLEQVKQNVASAARSGVNTLSAERMALIARVQQQYATLSPIPCTRCGYCMPCPQGIDIPLHFQLYNSVKVFGGNSVPLCRNLYLSIPRDKQASACIECHTCEDHCPQHIPISQTLPKVQDAFR